MCRNWFLVARSRTAKVDELTERLGRDDRRRARRTLGAFDMVLAKRLAKMNFTRTARTLFNSLKIQQDAAHSFD